MRTVTESAWKEEGKNKFGPNIMGWRFVCPACGYIASPQDWREAGATEGEVAFSCIGRALGSKKEIGDKTGGPCNYAGGGLFKLNPVQVEYDDGGKCSYFEFANPVAEPATTE